MRERRHDGSHGPDCFGCRIQTVNLSPAATPSRYNNVSGHVYGPTWERGIPTDERGMPRLGADGEPMRSKAWEREGGQFLRTLHAEQRAAAPVPLVTQGAD